MSVEPTGRLAEGIDFEAITRWVSGPCLGGTDAENARRIRALAAEVVRLNMELETAWQVGLQEGTRRAEWNMR